MGNSIELSNNFLRAGLKLNIKKYKILTTSPITSWKIEGGKVEA